MGIIPARRKRPKHAPSEHQKMDIWANQRVSIDEAAATPNGDNRQWRTLADAQKCIKNAHI